MSESLTRLLELILQSYGRLTPGELILRLSLIGCSMFAAIQLLSMWATNYGDRNATTKSFFLSLLLHCCFGLGWATVLDSMPRSPKPAGEPDESRNQLRVTFVSDEDNFAEQGDDKSLWNSVPRAAGSQMTRTQPDEVEQMPLDQPEHEQTPSQEPAPLKASLPSRVEEPSVAPVPESVESSPSKASPARITLEVEEPRPEARPEFAANTLRRKPMRETSSLADSERVEPQRGAAERTSPAIEDGIKLNLPSAAPSEATLPTLVGVTDEAIRRRSSPAPMTVDIVESGGNPSPKASVATGDRKTSRFTRAGNRLADSDSDQSPVPSPTPAPSTPNRPSIPERTVASRPIRAEMPDSSLRPEPARIESAPFASRPRAVRDPEPYRSRRLEQRKGIALENGGSEESERAVEASLRWMAGSQEPAGFWSGSKYGAGAAKTDPQGNDRYDGGRFADTGITGLIILSYLGAGYTHEEGKYVDNVSRALNWLIKQQTAGGYLGGRATRYDMMYCHSMATFALAEAYGMQADPNDHPELQEAVRRGVRLICSQQNKDGGWRYQKDEDPSDMSMFGWQLMALKSASNAGILIPKTTRLGMIEFLEARARGTNGGLAGYKINDRPSPSMTAEALFCRQMMFGAQSRNDASREAVGYLRQNLPSLRDYDEYYWYYGTLAMFQYDGTPWEAWNRELRDTLIRLQTTQGPDAGSWAPKGKWAQIGGRLYSTALSTMCLEVYYRFLRLYQTSEERRAD